MATKTALPLAAMALALGAITVLSSLIFWRLQTNDGNNVSNRVTTPEVAEAA